jgi:hypothetical protein
VETRFTSRGLDDPGRMPARLSQWRARIAREKQASKDWRRFTQECAGEWRDFGQQPGTHLWLVGTGIGRCELRTAEQQTVARLRGRVWYTGVSAGGRTFTRKPATGAGWAFVDEAGAPILHTWGSHWNNLALGHIAFPDRRWLQFPVRGTGRANAIMTAVDQDRNKVAQYRRARGLWASLASTTEITVHPEQPLTDELVLALAISARWLSSYFDPPTPPG